MKKYFIIIFVILIFAVIGWQAYRLISISKPASFYEWKNWLNLGQPNACTQEAKLCPDGSYVGRTGPNCEFAPCPGEEPEACKNFCGDGVCQEIVCLAIGCPCPETKQSCPQDCSEFDTANWQTYRNEEYGFSLKYPDNWEYSKNNNHLEFNEEGKVYKIEESITSPITLSIIANVSNKTAIDWANERNKYSGKITTLNVSQVSATQVSDYLGTETYIVYNGQRYTLATPNFGDEETNKTILGVYNQILSTFKFIE